MAEPPSASSTAMAPLTINGNLVSGDATPSATAKNLKYLYVRGKEPLKASHKRQLLEKKVEIFEYLGSNTYLCRYPPDDPKPVQDLTFVAQANVYDHRLKISDFLQQTVRNELEKHPEQPTITDRKSVV